MNTAQLLINNAKQYPNEPAISIKDASGKWETDNWSGFLDYTMEISKSFNVDAQIVGRVEDYEGKKLTINSEFGTFEY